MKISLRKIIAIQKKMIAKIRKIKNQKQNKKNLTIRQVKTRQKTTRPI